jgi:L-ascorbate metabolism protein UlaG (beta-lactamase superfamily)
MSISCSITLIGNAGFRLSDGPVNLFIDAFYQPIAGVAAPPRLRTADVEAAELILFTHAHGDHFDHRQAAAVACRTGAVVAGPASVIGSLKAHLPPAQLLELEPPAPARTGLFPSCRTGARGVAVTAFRTTHTRDHNSYLIETPHLRIFHDGDNEDTRRHDLAALGRLDALLIAPWSGSGWAEFIERLQPRRWFIMHLSAEELLQQQAGRFIDSLCDFVPDNLIFLRPGESFEFS